MTMDSTSLYMHISDMHVYIYIYIGMGFLHDNSSFAVNWCITSFCLKRFVGISLGFRWDFVGISWQHVLPHILLVKFFVECFVGISLGFRWDFVGISLGFAMVKCCYR